MMPNVGRRQWLAVWLGLASLGLVAVSPVSAQQPRLRDTYQGHPGIVFSVAFSADGKTLASGSFDTTIKLWDVATGKNTAPLQGHSGPVYTVAFSPVGKTLASGSGGEDPQKKPLPGEIRLW